MLATLVFAINAFDPGGATTPYWWPFSPTALGTRRLPGVFVHLVSRGFGWARFCCWFRSRSCTFSRC